MLAFDSTKLLGRVPEIPVPQTLTHAALQDSVGVWPSAYQSVQTTAAQTISCLLYTSDAADEL